MSLALLPMPPGDPAALESYASTLASAAGQVDTLVSSTVRVTADINSNANWTGSAADGYSAYTGSLVQAVGGTAPNLNQIASAVRNYAASLRTAQQKVAAYNKAAEAASCLSPKKQPAAFAALVGPRDDAQAAVIAADTAGDIAAADVQGSVTIQSVYLQQQVHLLDQQAWPTPAPSRGPEWGAAPPNWRQLAAAAAAQAANRQAFFGGDGLPPDPHVPEPLPPTGPANWDDKSIPSSPPVGEDGGE